MKFFKDKSNPEMNELVLWFQVQYPEIWKDMKESSHSPKEGKYNPYHLEDSVQSHTMMACKIADILQVGKMNKIAILLHDIGKPFSREKIQKGESEPNYNETARVEKETDKEERVHFRGHEGVSTIMAIEPLNELENIGVINSREKGIILKTISLHGELFNNIKDQKEHKPKKIVNMFEGLSDYETFITQVKCDSMGRFSTDNKDNSILGDKIYNQETYLKYKEEREIPDKDREIVIFIGLPGSGKSTLIDKEYSRHVRISRDDILMEYCDLNGIEGTYNERFKILTKEDHSEIDKLLLIEFNKARKSDKNIVIDMTNLSRKSRRKWLDKKFRIKYVLLLPTLKLLEERNSKREGKNIPISLIKNMSKRFSYPIDSEFDTMIVYS